MFLPMLKDQEVRAAQGHYTNLQGWLHRFTDILVDLEAHMAICPEEDHWEERADVLQKIAQIQARIDQVETRYNWTVN